MQTDVPDPPAMLAGMQLVVSPVDGETVVLIFTVPVNPNFPVTVVVTLPVFPGLVKVRATELRLKGDDEPPM